MVRSAADNVTSDTRISTDLIVKLGPIFGIFEPMKTECITRDNQLNRLTHLGQPEFEYGLEDRISPFLFDAMDHQNKVRRRPNMVQKIDTVKLSFLRKIEWYPMMKRMLVFPCCRRCRDCRG